MPPTLTTLPTELLISIFSNGTLQTRDLYALSTAGSRRITSVALPVFLARNRTSAGRNAEFVVDIWKPQPLSRGGTPDALAGLAVAAIIDPPKTQKYLKSLRCFFQPINYFEQQDGDRQHVSNLPSAVIRVIRHVNRFATIEKAQVSFIRDGYYVVDRWRDEYVPLEVLVEWRACMGTLLDTLVRKGCQELIVRYDVGGLQCDQFQLHAEQSSWNVVTKSLLSTIGMSPSRQTKRIKWDWIPPPGQEERYRGQSLIPFELSPTASRTKKLESFAIHSTLLVLPPFLDWTLAVLRTNDSLKHLMIGGISVRYTQLTLVLDAVANAVAGHLTSLSIYPFCTQMNLDRIIALLSHLPNLTSFYLDRRYAYFFQPTFPFKPKSPASSVPKRTLTNLSRLRTLHAPTSFIGFIYEVVDERHGAVMYGLLPRGPLSRRRASEPFARLTSLSVFLSKPSRTLETYDEEAMNVNVYVQRMTESDGMRTLELTMAEFLPFSDFETLAGAIKERLSSSANTKDATTTTDPTSPPSSETPTPHPTTPSQPPQLAPSSAPRINDQPSSQAESPTPSNRFIHTTHFILITFHDYPHGVVSAAWTKHIGVWLYYYFPRLTRLTIRKRASGMAESHILTPPNDIDSENEEDGDEEERSRRRREREAEDEKVLPLTVRVKLVKELKNACPKLKWLVVGNTEISLMGDKGAGVGA